MNPVFKKKFVNAFDRVCHNNIARLLNLRGKLMDFRAVTFVWKHKAVFDVARLDGEVHVPVYKRVHNPPPEANIYLCFIELRAFGFGIDYISVRILKQVPKGIDQGT
ncbi:uncharacterized protein OCT59_024472 [Rhizophagus irregularis]|uniref:uncharacterized protein n=1 Tax=Rhizophagus irregularis TaxID=588596 RepID=UPI00331D5364|nr:hypothetical protein OCT59_024472 [Rhizophagus irregularis]